jgi:hypothetical protein
MQTSVRVTLAVIIAFVVAFIGEEFGFWTARVLVERFQLVEGPPAGVLAVLNGLWLSWRYFGVPVRASMAE